MKQDNFIMLIIILFIIVLIISLFLIIIKNKKIEKFAIDKVNMRVTDTNNDVTGILTNNLIIYLKFNTGDFAGGNEITQYGKYIYNAKNIDSNYKIISSPPAPTTTCTVNSTDYVKGDASIQFRGSTGIIQEMLSNHLKSNFTIAFFIKHPDYNTTGVKTIVCQALQNPTLGWLIRINNTNLEVVLGTNIDNNWVTIISKPDFIKTTGNDWCHIALTYNNSENPKWNLYLDGIKELIPMNDNINRELKFLDTSYLTFNNGIVTNFNYRDNMHFLSIGCQITNNARNQITVLPSSINIEFLNIKFPLGNNGVNYIYSDNIEYFYIKFLNGTSQIIFPIECTVDILLVGGGGGGGLNGGWEGGGGGGGGGVGIGQIILKSSVTYTISIGNGGNGGAFNINSSCNDGLNGGNTYITGDLINEIAYGGGGGGWRYGITGSSGGGGSGHGGSYNGGNATKGRGTLNYYGNNGGYGHWASGGGGGGGAGSVGESTSYTWDVNGKKGGNGIEVKFLSNTPDYFYGGGGGGGAFRTHYNDNIGGIGGIGGGGNGGNTNRHGEHGKVNTGGGGGGACGWAWGGNRVNAGNGGSGVVIMRLKKSNFFALDKSYYKNTDDDSLKFGNFLPAGTLMDDFRVYNTTLNENQIKSVYYGRLITSGSSAIPTIDTTSGALSEDTATCISNSSTNGSHLTSVIDSSSSPSIVFNPQTEELKSYSTPLRPQFSQKFNFINLFGNRNIELLFSQPLSSPITPNPYTPAKLFNNDAERNTNDNYCAFLSTYALTTGNILYNYDTITGLYALTDFKVPDCGSFIFNDVSRPKGDYIYIKFPDPFVLRRYAFRAIPGFANRAPGKWTLYIKNSTLSITHPQTNGLKLEDYCQINNRTYYVDLNWTRIEDEPLTNEYLFVFQKIVGNNSNDKYGILAFQEMTLYKSNTALTLDTSKSAI